MNTEALVVEAGEDALALDETGLFVGSLLDGDEDSEETFEQPVNMRALVITTPKLITAVFVFMVRRFFIGPVY